MDFSRAAKRCPATVSSSTILGRSAFFGTGIPVKTIAFMASRCGRVFGGSVAAKLRKRP